MSAARFIPTFYLTHLNNGGVNLNFVNDLYVSCLVICFLGNYFIFFCEHSSVHIEYISHAPDKAVAIK